MEEIFILAEESFYNIKQKMKILAFIRNHLNNCVDNSCYFRKGKKFDNYLRDGDIDI